MNFYTGFFNVVGGGFNIGGSTNPGVGNAIITGALTIGGTTMPGAGNLALGAVPATALWSTMSGLIMGNANLMSQKTIGVNNSLWINNNAVHNGSLWIATSTDAATTYWQQNGSHTWATAPSVTAGNFLSFVERMKLYLSGGLYLGTSPTDPGAGNFKCSGIACTGVTCSGGITGTGIIVTDASVTNDIYGARLKITHPTQSVVWYNKADTTAGWIVGRSLLNTNLNDFFFYDYANNVTRMVIGSTGGVHIGSTVTDPGAGCLRVQNTLWISGDAYVSLAGTTSQQGFFIRVHDYDTGASTYMGGGMFLNGISVAGTTAGIANASLFRIYGQNTGDMLFHTNGGQSILFAPGNTLRMALFNNGGVTIGGTGSAGAGNLALGEVPGIAFASSLSVLSLSNVNIVTPKTIAANSYFYICNNMLFDGGAWRAISTDAGSIYYMQNGFHAWVNAASVTAGGTQSFQERMRLYLSGGLYVGTNPGGTDPGAGSIACTGVYKIGATQVVKGRIAGWGLPTGTLTRTALSNASTQAQFNQALMALITDLHATAGHGLIGT